jgi:poly(A) polymerase
MILRDNVFGSIEEDVMRRDFTVNALYYTVRNFEVHDYVDGLADIDLRCLRMIGDPEQRYKEDPVRILRALRLAAKLNFKLAPETEAPLRHCAELLDSIPAARLFDEFMKLFFAGQSERTYELLQEYGVFSTLFPQTGRALRDDSSGRYDQLLRKACSSTDARINEDKSVTPAFLLAVLLWPAVEERYKTLVAGGMSPLQANHDAGQDVLMEQLQQISIPKRFSMPMREIWDLQVRLLNRKGRRAEALLSHKRFRAAYDFLMLREAVGEDLEGLGARWTEFQQANPEQQLALQVTAEGSAQPSKPRRRRVKSRRKPPAAS